MNDIGLLSNCPALTWVVHVPTRRMTLWTLNIGLWCCNVFGAQLLKISQHQAEVLCAACLHGRRSCLHPARGLKQLHSPCSMHLTMGTLAHAGARGAVCVLHWLLPKL